MTSERPRQLQSGLWTTARGNETESLSMIEGIARLHSAPTECHELYDFLPPLGLRSELAAKVSLSYEISR